MSRDTKILMRPDVAAVGVDAVAVAGSAASDSDGRAARAMDSLRRVVRSLHHADANTEHSLGVTAAQLFVLREVAKAEPLTVSALARATATSQSSVSEVVTRLVARELLIRKRSGDDRRCAEIRLSPSGRDLLSGATETVQEQLLAGFQRLPEATQRSLSEQLAEWLVEAGLSDVGPSMFFACGRAPRIDRRRSASQAGTATI